MRKNYRRRNKMREFIFGTIPKKTVTVYEDGKITLEVKMFENGEIYADEIVKVFHKEATLLDNGEVYLSPDGNNHGNPLGVGTGFIYSKKQRDELNEFLALVESFDVRVSKVHKPTPAPASKPEKKKVSRNALKCPKCKSIDIEFMDNKRKSFSVGKAVGGAVLTGGIGTIAGFAGKKGKDRWHCKDCGNVFESKKK